MLSRRTITFLFALALVRAINVAASPTIVTHFPIPPSSAEKVAVNPSLNKIYVSGGAAGGQTVTVIDGSTFAQTTVGTGSGVFSVDTVNDQYWAGTAMGPPMR
jgi:DNA-binding beta-propeller fold protein YncE